MHTSASAIAEPRRPGKLSQAALLHQSDERLVILARSGSERAWAEITRRYGRQLRVYCARFVGVSRAEDAVQQTFLQAFLALRDGAPREIVLRAWLYRIAHNCSVDVLRKGTADYDELDLEHDGVAQPPTVFEQREEVRRIVARMRDLPAAQRQALALRELEGRSYEEISARLGHSGSGVRQLIFRARTALRNSAAACLPFGFLKARLSQPLPLECHHVATAVSVPASSGGGIDVVGAATLAVVAVLGGGLAASDGGTRRARAVPPAIDAGTTPPAVPPAALAAAPARSGSQSMRPRASRARARAAEPPATVTAPAGVQADLAPAATAVAPTPPAPPAAESAPAPPADAQAPDNDVAQQTIPAAGAMPPGAPGAGVTADPATTPPAPGAKTPPKRAAPGTGTTPTGTTGPGGRRPAPAQTPAPAPGRPGRVPPSKPATAKPSTPAAPLAQRPGPKPAPSKPGRQRGGRGESR